MIFILATLARKAGYLVAIGNREQGEIYDGKKLGSLASSVSPDLSGIPEANADRIKQIDMIWFDKKGIHAVFEVENTTAITEAIVRGSNLPAGEPIKKIIVLPEERERLLHRKLQEPMLAERMKQDAWAFMFYKDLTDLFESKKGKITWADISRITTQPRNPGGQLGLAFQTEVEE